MQSRPVARAASAARFHFLVGEAAVLLVEPEAVEAAGQGVEIDDRRRAEPAALENAAKFVLGEDFFEAADHRWGLRGRSQVPSHARRG
jgi:hypothetical protein